MDRLIEETAKELTTKKGTVKNVYKHIFWSVTDVMKRGECQNILLNEFGKFVVKPTRKKAIDTRKANAKKHGIKNINSDTNINKKLSNVDVLEKE